MAYVEIFARETSEASALACDNDPQLLRMPSYGVTIKASVATTIAVPAAIYRVWLEGRSGAVSVFLTVGLGTPTAQAPDSDGKNSIAFAGDMIARIRVPPQERGEGGVWAGQTVSARLSTGASDATLYLVPVVPWIDG